MVARRTGGLDAGARAFRLTDLIAPGGTWVLCGICLRPLGQHKPGEPMPSCDVCHPAPPATVLDGG